jgi:hypothetical protein
MTTPLPSEAIPEDRVAAILSRAAEIDRTTRETITVEALRSAAIDAGISAGALDTALAEYAAGKTAPPVSASARGHAREPRFARMRRLLRRLAGPARLAGLGILLGLIGGRGEGAVLFGFGGLVLAGGWLARRYRPQGRARGYVARIVAMAVGVGIGFAVGAVGDVAVALLPLTLALVIGGTLAIKVRARSRKLEAPAS